MSPYQAIADLETEIEKLTGEAERCRRIARVAKAAIVFGAILLLLAGFGRAGPVAILFGIAAVLGGTALAGSNRSTLEEIKARIHAQETRRAEMIDVLGLQDV